MRLRRSLVASALALSSLVASSASAQEAAPPSSEPADGFVAPDDIAPLEVPAFPGGAPMGGDVGGGLLSFSPAMRAKELCPYNKETESYSCPVEDLKKFNVLSTLRVSPPVNSTPFTVQARFDEEDGCLLSLDVDFGTSAAERRVLWKTSAFIVTGKESDFYVESATGDIEPGWETSTLILPNTAMKESVVGRKGNCLLDVLSDEVDRDSFFLDVQVEEGGQVGKHRIEVERTWTSTTIVEAARALPEPTEPLATAFWPWVLGATALCGVGGLCGAPLLGLGTLFSAVACVGGIGAATSNPQLTSLAAAILLGGLYVSWLIFIPTALVGAVVGLASGAGIGYGIASGNENVFPDDKESDARWLAWRAFRQKHGIPIGPPKPLTAPKSAQAY